MLHSHLTQILSTHQPNSPSHFKKKILPNALFFPFCLPLAFQVESVPFYKWLFSPSHWELTSRSGLLSVISSSIILIFHNKGSRRLGDPEFVRGFEGVMAIVIRINLFFVLSYALKLIEFPWVLPLLYLEECSYLLGLIMDCTHHLGDHSGNDWNALWTYSPKRWGGQVGRRFESRKMERRFYVCFITFSVLENLKRFMWARTNLNILTCQSQRVCWPKMDR